MADASPSQSRLTVLSGPLAGRELILDDVVDNILVGSDSSCRFHLDAAGISPIHARLWMDASGVTVYDTGSETGLYVNDDRVSGQAPLRNGDILWLGTPGSDDVIMIQCRLPVRVAPVPPAPTPVAEPVPPPQPQEIETMLIVPEAGAPAVPEVVAPPPIEEDTASLFAIATPDEPEVEYEAVSDAADLVPDQEPAQEAVLEPAEETAPEVLEDEPATLVAAHASEMEFDQTQAIESPEVLEDEPATLVAAHAGEMEFEQTQAIESPEDLTAAIAPPPPAPVPEEPVKFSLDYEDQPPPFAVPESPTPVFEDETESPTVMVTREAALEHTMAMPFTAPEPEPTVMAPIVAPVVEPPAPAPPPPAPPPRPKAAPAAAPPPPKPRPATPPVREPRPPRPEPAPTAAPARAAGGSGSGRLIGMGVGALVVLGILGYVGMRFMGGGAKPAPPVTVPTTMAAAPPTTEAPAPPTTQAAAAPVDEGVTVVKTPPPTIATPAALPSPVTKATPAPTPTPAVAKGPSPAPTKAPTVAVATPPPGPSAEAVKAQQVATLLGQADSAAGAHSYDQAAGFYDEALKLDPGNAKASAGKAAAVASAASFKKTFVSGKTVVSGGKGAKALSGFDSEDVSVSKAPDYSGRIEFEVTPRNVKPGDSYSVKVFLTNDGKKSFKIGSLTVSTTANGSKTGGPASASVKEVQPQQRVSLQETTGSWQDGTNSWNLEVAVVSDHGDTFKNTVTWR